MVLNTSDHGGATLLPLPITRLVPEYDSPPTLSRQHSVVTHSSPTTPTPGSPIDTVRPQGVRAAPLADGPVDASRAVHPLLATTARRAVYTRGTWSARMHSMMRDSTGSMIMQGDDGGNRESVATIVSSQSLNLRELPRMCNEFPLPPPVEEPDSSFFNPFIAPSHSEASFSTFTQTECGLDSPILSAQVHVAHLEHVQGARGVSFVQVHDASPERSGGKRMSLISTETGESVTWATTPPQTVSPTRESTRRPSFGQPGDTPTKPRLNWLPVLAPVWGGPIPRPPTEDYDQMACTEDGDGHNDAYDGCDAYEVENRGATPDAIAARRRTLGRSWVSDSSYDADEDGYTSGRGTTYAAETRESLAAWDEDMPRVSQHGGPSEWMSSTEHLSDSDVSTAGTSPSTTLAPHHAVVVKVDRAKSDASHAPTVPSQHAPQDQSLKPMQQALVSQFSFTTTTAGTEYESESDHSDTSDKGKASLSIQREASPFGRNSFGCDDGDDDDNDDATSNRARKLRAAFFANPSAGRSHASLTSLSYAQDGGETDPSRAESTRMRGNSADSVRERDAGIVQLRTAVLPQDDARRSVESLPMLQGADIPLRKRSLNNLMRKREQEHMRRSEDKKLPPLPSHNEEGAHDEYVKYYYDPDPKSVFNVCNDVYLRKTLLSPPEPEIDEVFDVWRPPSQRRLWEAGTCCIRNEDGEVLPFSDLFPTWDDAQSNRPPPRTVLFFMRHFWCGPCQDYTLESISKLDPDILAQHNIRVAVIGSGHWKMLRPYRKFFKCPFPFYTDGPRHLFELLGMIKKCSMMPYRMPFSDRQRAGYNHRPLMKQAVSGFKNAFLHFPIRYPGHSTQLGGEFVLSPGFKCDFAHRMTTMTNHMEAWQVMQHAGVDHPNLHPSAQPKPGDPLTAEQLEARDEIERVARELQEWQTKRDAELNRMRSKKASRRGGLVAVPDDKALRRASGGSGWSGYVRNILREEAAAELDQMPPVPEALRSVGVPDLVDSESNSTGPSRNSRESGTSSLDPYLPRAASSEDMQACATPLDGDSSGLSACDSGTFAAFGGIPGSPLEPEYVDPERMQQRFAAAMDEVRDQEREHEPEQQQQQQQQQQQASPTSSSQQHDLAPPPPPSATHGRWTMPAQLPQHDPSPAGEVGVAL